MLPGIDDGCADVAESIACGRMFVEAGYSHAVCTPHFWPTFPDNTVPGIVSRVQLLQTVFDRAGVALRLVAGGEIGLRDGLTAWPREAIPTYGMAGRYVLFDFWADELPPYFWPTVNYWISLGLQPILAHPERIRAFHRDPHTVVDVVTRGGVWLQGNLQCLSDPRGEATREIAEELLQADRYVMLGSDVHKPETLACRLEGLRRAIDLVGLDVVERLTRTVPARLLGLTL